MCALEKISERNMVEEEVINMSTGAESGPLKAHFVLVHGISNGSWCWYKVRSLLENSGYWVSCIDLKGAGIDRADPNSVLAFDDYNKPLIDFMKALPENEKVILVGHSAGGLSVTQATFRFANKISLAVYVSATMLKLGFCTDEDLKQGIPDFSEFGDVNELTFGLGHDQPPTSAIVKKEFQRKIIYHMSPQEDSTLASMLLRPGPIQALAAAKFNDEEDDDDVEKVPRVYIRTLHDRVIRPDQQDAMIKRWQPCDVYVMDSDHSPFFSNPLLLSGLLVKAAASVGCI